MVQSIKNDIIEISAKSLGAELTSIKTVKDGTEFLWQGNKDYWVGQSTILFPIIGGLPDGRYTYDGKEYCMEAHGFTKRMEFELAEKTQSLISYKISNNEDTLRQYPFKFELYISYAIEGNIIRHRFKVNNLDEKKMLFSVGGHPGFNCPLYEGEKMEDYRLVFENPETLKRRIKTDGLLSGEKEDFLNNEKEKTLTHNMFYNGAVIVKNMKSKWLEIRNAANPRIIRVEFNDFPDLGIWSAPNDGPFVCIEPWYGVDSTKGDPYDFEKKEGLLRLESGKSFECEYRIIIT